MKTLMTSNKHIIIIMRFNFFFVFFLVHFINFSLFQSYRHYPSNLEVLDWLGAYFVEMKVPEKAVDYFEQASLMQPSEPKWLMLIGSCYRRAGNFQLALQTYKDVLNKFPDNTECILLLNLN